MLQRLAFGLLLLSVSAVANAATTTILVNDFEGAQTTDGGGPNNGGLAINSTTSPGVRADFDFTTAVASSVAGLGGSATAVQLDLGLGPTFDGLFDLPSADIFSAQPMLLSPSLTSAVLTFDYSILGSTNTDIYNELRVIANTDNTDGNTFDIGASLFPIATGAASGTASLDFTDLVAFLDPSVNPGYSTLRLLSNKDAASSIGIVIDNVRLTTTAIPEPSAALVLGAIGIGYVVRRRSNKSQGQ